MFKALADSTRRALLDRLEARTGQTLGEFCDGLAMARQSVSKHLALLAGAGVVTTYPHHLHPHHGRGALAELIEPASTSRYWGVELSSDWQVGSVVSWRFGGATMADDIGVVVESNPPRRLSYYWHPIIPEFGRAIEIDAEEVARLAAEPRSKVSFDRSPRANW